MNLDASLARKTIAPLHLHNLKINPLRNQKKEPSPQDLQDHPSIHHIEHNTQNRKVHLKKLTRFIGVISSQIFYNNKLPNRLSQKKKKKPPNLELIILLQNRLRQLRKHISWTNNTAKIQQSINHTWGKKGKNLNALTRTPCAAHSTPKLAARCLTAALDALYGACSLVFVNSKWWFSGE